MKFDIYFSYSVDVKVDGETTESKSTRKNLKGIDKGALATVVNDMIKSIPDDATETYLELHKKYDEDKFMNDVASY